MLVKPRNRRLLIEKLKNEDRQNKNDPISSFHLPEDVETKGNEIYRVLKKAPDVTLEVEEGDLIFIEKSMLSRTTCAGHEFFSVLENYVSFVVELQEKAS